MITLSIPKDSGFGLANLPYGVYSVGGAAPRVGTRVGDTVVDLALVLAAEDPGAEALFATDSLATFMSTGPAKWAQVRETLQRVLAGEVPKEALHPVASVRMHLPCEFADYVDFYASEHHASNLGRLFRPDNPDPLMPNWKHLPVGYHGRSSTIVESGVDIVRPSGQRKGPGDEEPTFGPSTRLDIEAEMGFIVGVGNEMGSRISVDDASTHLFGAVIFNDWSARDIQAWEYVPLGPNLGKSFASSVSPWVVPMAALADAKVSTPTQDPTPLPYLHMDDPWTLDVDLEVEWNGQVVSRPPFRTMYWSPAQMLAHTTVNGARTRTGDIFASGTISGPDKEQRGAFIELTWGGKEPIQVGGEERTFLQDGDTITIRATAPGANGERISFGEVTATILPTPPLRP
ncbi:putative fumarylacetoacetase [Mobilicoccus caccae]|uniref:fumarylacetoacetase n=2 Tax=Mobilicoccus caccae TaxID=1859295 RepID=A0ABQ6IVV0_9MICO|nr:fumarylacetoacetase [Mobilicoccus caccae]GMA41413.1 putative fumarylacetoacetase [Mobilicoccus caccae]